MEFPQFPAKLIELIDLCLKAEKEEVDDEQANEDFPREAVETFSCRLDTASGLMHIVESNVFKQVIHISLQMRQGNDAAIKAYLAGRLKLALSELSTINTDLVETKETLEMEVKVHQTMEKELNDMKTHSDVSFESLRSAHTEEIAKMKMALMESAEEERKRYEGQLESARGTIDTLHADLKAKTTELEESTIELKREKQHLEFRERELTRLLETAEADRDRVFGECKAISEQRRKVEEVRASLERDLARSEAKGEALVLQLADREEMVAKSASLQFAAEEARRLTEEKLDIYVADNENLHEKIKQGSSEITRGNSVIQRLQQDKKTLTEKMKTKSDVIRKQDDVVEELKSRLAEADRKVHAEHEATRTMQQKYETAASQLEESLGRLEESAKLISSNQEVISYLNEEINKWQLGLRSGTEAEALLSGASGSGLGVSRTVRASKWKDFDQNVSSNSAAMFSPDTTKDLSYGGYVDDGAKRGAAPADASDITRGLRNLGLEGEFVKESDVNGYGLGDGDVPLEQMAYYADAEAKSEIKMTDGAGSNTKPYAWQAEDFGLQ